MTSQTAIQTFGKYDFARLVNMGSDDILKIDDIKTEELQKAADAIRILIKTGRLYMMDKESGIPWNASVVIGYKENGQECLLIAHER